jgi:hypothetical protein
MGGTSGRRNVRGSSLHPVRRWSNSGGGARDARRLVWVLLLLALVALVPGAIAPGAQAASTSTNGLVSAQGNGQLIPISQLVQRPAAATAFPQVIPQLAARTATSANNPAQPAAPSGVGPPPTLRQSFEGIFDPGITPPDTNGAAGPTRQVEIVNSMLGIWDRGSPPRQLAQMSLASLTGSSGFLVDPRVTWDAQTERFYYAIADDTNRAVLTGFSTTADPSSPSDWCRYAIPQANRIDQPRLGDTQDFILTGFFLFFGGPQVAWYQKPPPGPSCPPTLQSGEQSVPAADTVTADPAHEIDPTPTGYVLSGQSDSAGGHLDVIHVTKDAAGNAVFSSPTSIPVAAFAAASPVPQEGTSQLLDVGDPRLQQVVGAVDPSHKGRFALWTDQTVAGGAGSAIRWFEINPATDSLFQSGTVASPTLWVFDGAISPDRLVNGGVTHFGGSMVLTFNSSSSTSEPAIWIVSKRGRAPQSPPLLVQQSQVPYLSFDCATAGSVCRWGDYSGAAPDPAASRFAPHGVVWGANEWNAANPNPTGATAWRTWIFSASP